MVMEVQQAHANRALSAVPLVRQAFRVGDDIAALMVMTSMILGWSLPFHSSHRLAPVAIGLSQRGVNRGKQSFPVVVMVVLL